MKQRASVFVLIYILIALTNICRAQIADSIRIEHLKSFAKLYGYVRWFHPGKEAQSINWDKFAYYGVQEVMKTTDSKHLANVLYRLFKPIAPGIVIQEVSAVNTDLTCDVIPPEHIINASKEVYWQYEGIDFANNEDIYESRLINGSIPPRTKGYSSVYKKLEAGPYHGKNFILKAKVQVLSKSTNGFLWVRIDTESGRQVFFDNMNDRPISSNEWREYSIEGKVVEEASAIYIGAYTDQNGILNIDDVSFSIVEGNNSKAIYINGFESELSDSSDFNRGIGIGSLGQYGIFERKTTYRSNIPNAYLQIDFTQLSDQRLFAAKPNPLECINKDIGSGLICSMPINLLGKQGQTWPSSDQVQFRRLVKSIAALDTASDFTSKQIVDVIITWNIFQHFYPYWDTNMNNWDKALTVAISDCLKNANPANFLLILRKLTAKVNDGHIWVAEKQYYEWNYYMPPFSWEWIDGKLVITQVDSNSTLNKGDIVLSINGNQSETLFEEKAGYISAATPGWLKHRLATETLWGEEGSILMLDVLSPDSIRRKKFAIRSWSEERYNQFVENPVKIKKITDSVIYLNLNKISMSEIDDLLSELVRSKAVICDLRGYPNGNHDFIRHILPFDDTCGSWLQVPQFIYPDHLPSSYKSYGWKLTKKEPHIRAKVIFIIDGSAISYAESYLGFISHYKLATIVGQTSAGTNGDVNSFVLPGGYRISFTGTKVLKLNGDKFHGVGYEPDIVVEKTISSVISGRDVSYEKAIELAR